MDKLSTYYREHAQEMDRQEPSAQSWLRISEQLDLANDRHKRMIRRRYFECSCCSCAYGFYGGAEVWLVSQMIVKEEVFPQISSPQYALKEMLFPFPLWKIKKVVLVKILGFLV